jgi:protein NrfD
MFGLFAFISALMALEEAGTVRSALLRRVRDGALRKLIIVLGGLFGFVVAGYTGILLSVTNRPIWADTQLVGLLFLFSASSTAAAVLILLGRWRGADDTIDWLSRLDRGALVLEFLVLIALVISLGSVARVWLSSWGALLVGMVLAGIFLPLTLHSRPHLLGRMSLPAGAAPALVGGFLLRMVIVLSAEGV